LILVRSGRITGNPEVTPKMEFCPDWRQSNRTTFGAALMDNQMRGE
jgi:hypothetical protein